MLLAVGCGDSGGPEVGDVGPGGDTPAAFVCEAPDSASGAVLTRVATIDLCSELGLEVPTELMDTQGGLEGYGFVHLTELGRDVDRDITWGAGSGGLFAVQEQADGSLALIGQEATIERLYTMTMLGDGRVAGTTRYKGVALYDTVDTMAPTMSGFKHLSSPGGVAEQDELLHVLTYTGSLITVSTPLEGSPNTVAVTAWEGQPWRMVVDGDRGYVADALAGIVVLDLTVADAPAVIGTFPELVGLQDIAVGTEALYAAAGAAGLAVYDLSDRDAPALVTTRDVGWSVASVEVDGDRLWLTTQEALVLMDVTAPTDPQPWAFEVTEEWAFDTVADGDRVWVADWCRLEVWELDPDAAAPSIDVSAQQLTVGEATPGATLQVVNRGNDTLNILDLSVSNDLLSASTDIDAVAPGEAATVTVEFIDVPGAGPMAGSLCVVTDDPRDPALEVLVSTSKSALPLAVQDAPATDFLLFDLEGEPHQLSDYYGQPVVLLWFASW